MLGRVREFIQDLGPGMSTGLGLLAGATLGIAATLQVTGGSPYSQADLDRVAAHAQPHDRAAAADQSEGNADKSRRRIERLKQKSDKLSDQLKVAQGTIDQLRGDLDAAEATPSTEPDPSADPGTDPATTPDTAANAGVTVSGTLESAWILSSRLKPWPTDCTTVSKTYQVRVNSGDTTVALGSPVSSKVIKRTTKDGLLSLSCRTTYRATVPNPLDSVYEFVAVSAGTPDKALDTALAQRNEIGDGTGPDLIVTFCPECSKSSARAR
jgi:hypothetical protein